MAKILVAEDEVDIRELIAISLRFKGYDVITAANGQEAVNKASTCSPDLILMDVRMPVLSGVEATRRIRETMPEVQVLVLTAYDDDQYIFSLLQAGARGYLLKTAPVSELVKAIRLVKSGESPLDPSIARKVVVRMADDQGSRTPFGEGGSPIQSLTFREQEVLQLLSRGLNNQAIAEALYVSDRTVQAHLTNIFAKMGVSSRLEAVLTAIRRGWLTLDI